MRHGSVAGEGSPGRDPVAKAIHTLSWMADAAGDDWGVRQIARGLNLAPSTVHRILTDLVSEGLVIADSTTGRYSLGIEMYRLAWRCSSRFPLREIATAALKKLVAGCNETAFLAVYDHVRRRVMFIATVESSHELRYVLPLNRWSPIILGSSGLAILAALPREATNGLFDDLMRQENASRVEERMRDLERELAAIRARGYARTMGQRTPGAVGISAAVLDSSGPVGSVGLTIPISRFRESDEPHLSSVVMKAADEVTAKLGSRKASRVAAMIPSGLG